MKATGCAELSIRCLRVAKEELDTMCISTFSLIMANFPKTATYIGKIYLGYGFGYVSCPGPVTSQHIRAGSCDREKSSHFVAEKQRDRDLGGIWV